MFCRRVCSVAQVAGIGIRSILQVTQAGGGCRLAPVLLPSCQAARLIIDGSERSPQFRAIDPSDFRQRASFLLTKVRLHNKVFQDVGHGQKQSVENSRRDVLGVDW